MLSSKNPPEKLKPQGHKNIKRHQKTLFFKNLVPWCLGGCFLKRVERDWLTVPCF